MSTIVLQLSTSGDEARLAVGHIDARPVEHALPAGALAATVEEIATLLRPIPGMAVRGRDAARSRAEEEAGRALGRLLGPRLRERLHYLLGEARGRGELACIAVDCPDAVARALPWELLALEQAPLEALGEAVIVRRLDGPRPGPAPAAGPLALALWSPDPADPLTAARVQALCAQAATRGVGTALIGGPAEEPGCAETIEAHAKGRVARGGPRPASGLSDGGAKGGIPRVNRPAAGVSTGLVRPADAVAPAAREVLVVVCHGAADAASTRLLLGEDERAAATAGHLLGPRAARALAVVLEVCEAGAGEVPEIESLAGRLVAVGARAVVAARGRLAAEAASAFDAEFLQALAAGRPLPEALAAGRRAVRALGSPRPDARWHLPSLFVSSLEVLRAEAAPPAPPTPEGWPAPAADTAGWLGEAARLAEDAGRGFLGVEHLLLALPAGRGALALARHALEARRAPLLAGLGALQRRGEPAGLAPTPRLLRLASALEPGFDADDLWAALAAEPALAALLDLSSASAAASFRGQTLEAAPPWASGHPTALELVGGPEDGRVLRPAPGEWIGRAEAENPDGLYPRPGPVDPYLSRRHLRWLGEGRVSLARPGRLIRAGEAERAVAGELALVAGDVLLLSPVTRLLAREAP